jgi:hypothetical protein
MPESVNCWMPIPGPAGQLFHADPQRRKLCGNPKTDGADATKERDLQCSVRTD